MPPKQKTATKGKELVLPAQEEKEAKKKSPKQKERRKNPTRQPKKLETTKTKKTATKKENETKKMKLKQGQKPCAVVYRTGECELFPSEEKARTEHQSLPAGKHTVSMVS